MFVSTDDILRISRGIRGYFYKQYGSRADFDEILSIALSAGIRALPDYKYNGGKQLSFAIQRARWRVLDYFRELGAERRLFSLQDELGAWGTLSSGGITEAGRLLIRRLVAELPDRERQAVLLVGLEDKTMTEAAKGAGISRATMRKRWVKAQRLLREGVEEYERAVQCYVSDFRIRN